MYFVYYLAFGAAFYTWLFCQAEYERGACRWSKWAGRAGLLFVAAVLLALSGCGMDCQPGPGPNCGQPEKAPK